MKRFIKTNFILSFLNNPSLADIQTLKLLYEEFTEFLFAEKDNFNNLEAYRNALVFTIEELSVMKIASVEKKLLHT